MALPTVTLTGTYVRPDGTPLRGWVDFCPPSTLTFPDEPTFISCCSRARLDENGHFTVDLVATDAPGGNVEDWQYRVEENLDCPGGQRTYYIELVLGLSPIDLAELAPTTQPPNLNYLRLPGPTGPAGETAGTVLTVSATSIPTNAPTVLALEVDGTAQGVQIQDGAVVLEGAGLWAVAATLHVTSDANASYTVTTWLEWEEEGTVRTSPENLNEGQTLAGAGFDAYHETLLVFPEQAQVYLYVSVDNTQGDDVQISGRAAVGALLLRST